jgi:membrane fusion protein
VALHNLYRPEMTAARAQRVYGEIVLVQPVRIQALSVLLFAAAAVLTAWVILGTYTRTQIAHGLLVTDRASAKVIAVRTGLLTELAVREGQFVERGQRLATVQVEQPSGTGRSAATEILSALQTQHGLNQDQIRLAGARAATERARLSANLAGLRQQRSDLARQMTLQDETISSARDLLDRIQTVVDKGYVSRVELERRRQAWMAARQELERLRQQSNAVVAQQAAAASDLDRISADAGTQIAAARMEVESIAQRKAQLESERAYAVTAPIAGRITAIQASAGRTVDPAIPLLAIVPEGSRLHAEIYAPSRAIGFVRSGQEVRLLYDAFPYQRFGSFAGRITRVSGTVLDPRELSAPLNIDEPVYRIEVAPERQNIDAYGQFRRLQPGMTLTANIVLDRRSFADWLLEPLYAVLRRDRS